MHPLSHPQGKALMYTLEALQLRRAHTCTHSHMYSFIQRTHTDTLTDDRSEHGDCNSMGGFNGEYCIFFSSSFKPGSTLISEHRVPHLLSLEAGEMCPRGDPPSPLLLLLPAAHPQCICLIFLLTPWEQRSSKSNRMSAISTLQLKQQ